MTDSDESWLARVAGYAVNYAGLAKREIALHGLDFDIGQPISEWIVANEQYIAKPRFADMFRQMPTILNVGEPCDCDHCLDRVAFFQKRGPIQRVFPEIVCDDIHGDIP
jgi:hypothetical protein